MKRILIVDDEADICEILADFLEIYDFECTLANSAQTAREVFKDGQFDIVLSDVKMPGESGLDLVKWIHDQFDNPCPVIFMTGFTDVPPEELIAAGANDVIAKPFELDAFLEKIQSLVGS